MAAPGRGKQKRRPVNEKPYIVNNGLTMQGFLITYCSPCELSSV